MGSGHEDIATASPVVTGGERAAPGPLLNVAFILLH
jgi:hypothetical protein